jgi:hypothetical protein
MPSRRAALAAAVALALCLPALAGAAQAGDPITAVKREGPVVLDGRLDERAWASAPAFDGFVQIFPEEGATPTESTEVRVLYDDQHLYVGVIARDRQPERIQRPLGRRDSSPYSDAIAFAIDPMRDGRLGYYFEINAAGVLTDALVFENDQSSGDWDAVWEGVAAPLPDGWSAEARIPLSVMRFTDAPVQTWGFAVKRVIGRSHEELLTVLIPRGARGQLARFGPLVGLADMRPVPDLQITPYLAGRLSLRPEDPDDDVTPHAPRLADPVADLGFDVRASLGRSLALQATVNPDFGQVEADQLIQNLSTFEAFFPEKRPFFLQGMDLFQPASVPGRNSPQQLFYSRRIGLDAPILAAAKVTGRVGEAFQVGLLESVVTGAGWDGWTGSRPPRDVRFSWSQPFRLGPRSALPEQEPASRNFLVGVAKWQPAPSRSYGLTLASALPLGKLCSQADEEADDGQPRCAARGGNALALDWNVTSPGAEYFFVGQATGSQVQGGPPARTLPDGTELGRGDLGWGGHVAAGRNGGEGLRGEVHWQYESPRLDVNATGFQRTQNENFGRVFLSWVKPKGGGPFHYYSATAGTEAGLTTDGRGLTRAAQVWINAEVQTRGFQWFGCVAATDFAYWDVREISQTGDAYRRPTSDWWNCWTETDASKPISVNVWGGSWRTRSVAPFGSFSGWSAGTNTRFRPHPRLETRVEVQYERNGWPARYVDDDASGDHVFADLRAPLLSFTLRQQLVLTPRLTLQGYAQLFTSYGSYGRYFRASGSDDRVGFADLVPLAARPAEIDEPSFRDVGLNVNVVLRWEYRAGSTLFLVYTRSQAELADGARRPASLRPQSLGLGPTTDTFLVKWTYFWNG